MLNFNSLVYRIISLGMGELLVEVDALGLCVILVIVIAMFVLVVYYFNDRRQLHQKLFQAEYERRKAQEEARAVQKERVLLTDTISASLNEIYIFDAVTFHFRFANNGALHNLGYSLHQLQTMTPLDLIRPEFTPEMFGDLIQPLFEQKKQIQILETTHHRANGSSYPVEVHLQLFDYGGDRVFLAVINDISERKQAEKELRKLSRAVEQSPVSIVITDRNGVIEYVNPRFSQVSGYTLQEALGKNFRILKSGQTPPELYEDLWRTLTTGAEWHGELCNRKKNGDLYWESLSISPTFNMDGEITHFISVREDITARKTAEIEKNRHVEELEMISQVSKIMRIAHSRPEIYQVILGQLFGLLKAEGAAIALCDPQTGGTVVELGYGVWEDWTGRRTQFGQGISGRVVATGQLYLNNQAQNDPYMDDIRLLRGLTCVVCTPFITSGQVIGVLWIGRMFSIGDHDLRLLSAIGEMGASAIHRQSLYEDLQTQLSVLHSTQARLLQSEKLAAVGELVAGVAHELNNPLASVILLSHLIQQRNPDNLDGETLRDLEQINDEAQRAARIVRGLLDFARQHPVERRPVQINTLLENSLDLLKYELQLHRIECQLQLSPDLPVTLADPVQLKQVFVNLINNAWQAISANRRSGRITIKTGLGTPDLLNSRSNPATMLWVAIRDDGPGIPPAVLPRIFDPFFTTKPEGKGTGLGLSICHGIIAEHAGNLWAENNTDGGGGATFFVQLPVISATAPGLPPVGETSQTVTISPQNLHIMIIDDETSVLSVLTRTLKRAGYQVDAAGNGTSALAYLEKTRYDLILCDMRMPDLNGTELYWKVMEKDPEMAKRIIFTTGDVVSPSTRQFFEETSAVYLAKPFELKQLVEYVHHILMKWAKHDSS